MDVLKIPIDSRFTGKTIKEFLHFFNVAKAKIYLLEHEKKLTVNYAFRLFDQALFEGDLVTIDLEGFENLDFIPEYDPIEILYEDNDILVVNKPSGIIIHPAEKDGTGTLVNRIAGYYEKKGLNRNVRYLHRLDTETTGCLLIAKHFLMHSYLANHWDHLEIKRHYLALVTGQFVKDQGTISESIGKDRHNNNRYRVKFDGEKAITHYEVIDKYPTYSLLRIELLTGKTHQIRVHMSFMGHPLLGDQLYGGKPDRINRVALHSESIEFTNPVTGLPFKVANKLPEDMQRLL